MRPGGYSDMDTKGVKKRLKDKAFAAGVSRDDISDACNGAGITLDDLIAFITPRQAAKTAALNA
jgi:predicted hydrolase (HD superfamily)